MESNTRCESNQHAVSHLQESPVMEHVRSILVPAKLIRIGDYIPMGGWVMAIRKSGTKGLFPKSYITLAFNTGDDFTMESHIPFDVERIYEQVAHPNKEKK